MGFTTGFTGGVTLTLSLAYLAVLSHQRNRQAQADILRVQTDVLNSLTRVRTSPSTLSEISLATARQTYPQQESFVETAKARWNAEVAAAVRWAQNKDWAEVREQAEGLLARLWGTLAPTTSVPTTPAFESSSDQPSSARTSISNAAAAGKERVAEVRHALEAGGREAAEEARAAVTKGLEKGKELVGRAKASIALAEERYESKFDSKLMHLSEVERALQQRYEKSDVMNKSVQEVLNERYKPIDQRDNTKLRGI
ncbi:hypothetical protein VTK73DRAFT_6713 [Phialemonium thermophilum]|uniref:MICOS complex subunit MIC12 n=1 Tax=Phialemonium thermophilum TaxID=223376 RepID=A0ABR3XV72_9PEZI